MSMASKYSRGFESAARWPKTTSSRWSCVGAGRGSRGAGEVSARRTRAGSRRRRRQKNVGEVRLNKVRARQDARRGDAPAGHPRSFPWSPPHAPAGAPVVLVPFRGDERPAFRGRRSHASAPRARATLVPETHVSFPPSFPNSSPDARAPSARRGGARALARAPRAPRSPRSPSDDTHRASDAAKECRSRHATLEKGKDREEEERAFDKGVVNGGPRRCENEKISFIFLNPKSTGYFRRADVRRRKRFSDTSCAFPFRSTSGGVLDPPLCFFSLR